MAKANPNRQELIQFINEMTSELSPKLTKVEDLGTGVHYLHLLHRMHPEIVKLARVNTKASQEYENINNIKLLAQYLSQLKAPFSFDVQKTSQKNYQENLNLLRNLYKYYHSAQKSEQSVSRDQISNRKPTSKFVVKAPPKIVKQSQVKKSDPEKNSFKSLIDGQQEFHQQIKKIMVVVKNQENEEAVEKLNKIKKILGLEVNNSYSKRKEREKSEIICQSTKVNASKSSSKKNLQAEKQFEAPHSTTMILRSNSKTKNEANPENNINTKKTKVFDCEQVRKTAIQRFEEKPITYQNKSESIRSSKENGCSSVKQEADEDTRFVQNLLSPQPEGKQRKQTNIFRNSVRKSQRIPQMSAGKNFNQNLASIQKTEPSFDKRTTEKNVYVSAKKVPENQTNNQKNHISANRSEQKQNNDTIQEQQFEKPHAQKNQFITRSQRKAGIFKIDQRESEERILTSAQKVLSNVVKQTTIKKSQQNESNTKEQQKKQQTHQTPVQLQSSERKNRVIQNSLRSEIQNPVTQYPQILEEGRNSSLYPEL